MCRVHAANRNGRPVANSPAVNVHMRCGAVGISCIPEAAWPRRRHQLAVAHARVKEPTAGLVLPLVRVANKLKHLLAEVVVEAAMGVKHWHMWRAGTRTM